MLRSFSLGVHVSGNTHRCTVASKQDRHGLLMDALQALIFGPSKKDRLIEDRTPSWEPTFLSGVAGPT